MANGLYEDESDAESISDTLSPSDGYFNGRQHPQAMHVPDPAQASSVDKAREAREEREAETELHGARQQSQSETTNSNTSRAQPDTPLSPTRRGTGRGLDEDEHTEQTPLLPTVPAPPPTYSDAVANRSGNTHTARSSTRGGYDSIAQPESFFPEREPHDLGGEESNGKPPGWRTRVKSLLPTRKTLSKYLLITLVIILGIGFITNAILGLTNGRRQTKPGQPIDEKPPYDGRIPWPDKVREICPAAEFPATVLFDFDKPTSFYLYQLTQSMSFNQDDEYRRVIFGGEVHVRPALDDQEIDSTIKVEGWAYYDDFQLLKHTSFEKKGDGTLQVTVPSHYARSDATSDPCLYLTIDVVVPKGMLIPQDFSIQSESMTIKLHEGLNFTTKSLSFATITSDIITDSAGMNFTAENILASTGSGSQQGSWPLYEKLELRSTTGAIVADIEPKVIEKYWKPAMLNVGTSSGRVAINTPLLGSIDALKSSTAEQQGGTSDIPDRKYATSISSTTSSITANIIHGSSTSLSSNTGSIKARLTPFGPQYELSSLDCTCRTGSLDVHVLSPKKFPGKAMSYMRSTISIGTGSTKLHYPSEWEGSLQAKTMTGSVRFDWPGLKTWKVNSRSVKDGLYSTWKGEKGSGSGYGWIKYDGLSGSVTFKGDPSPDKSDRENSPQPPSNDSPPSYSPAPGQHPADDIPKESHPGEEQPVEDAPMPRWPGYDDEWGMSGS